jgi:hypothetical protein
LIGVDNDNNAKGMSEEVDNTFQLTSSLSGDDDTVVDSPCLTIISDATMVSRSISLMCHPTLPRCKIEERSVCNSTSLTRPTLVRIIGHPAERSIRHSRLHYQQQHQQQQHQQTKPVS